MKHMLTLDCGSTMCKAVIFSLAGREMGSGSSKPKTLYPEPGRVERDPEDLWNHAAQAIKKAIEESGLSKEDITCVIVTGYGNGVHCLGEDNQPVINGILSLDTRAAKTVATLRQEGIFEHVHPIHANQLWASSPPVLMRWFKDAEPGIYDRIRHICFVKDFIKLKLTGELSTDRTDVTGGALGRTSDGEYEREILQLYGIPEVFEKLPPVFDSWTIGGYVTRASSLHTGLAEGTPVAMGGMDVHMTALGCGCIEPGQMNIVAGSWSINSLLSNSPLSSPDILFTTTHVIPRKWFLMDGSPSSATNLDWFVEHFCYWEKTEAEKRGVSPFEVVNETIEGMDPSSCAVIFHPFLYGSNTQASARAGFYGLGGWHTRADMIRAVLEGVCFSHLTHVEKLRKVRLDREAVMAGGGKRSAVWTQMFSDILNVPLKIPESDELGALGCAITGAVASGCYPDHKTAVKNMCSFIDNLEPDPQAHDIYMKKYELYTMLLRTLSPAWDVMYQT